MIIKMTTLIALAIILFSFSGDEEKIEFSYPKNKAAKFTMTTDKFKKFNKEWRGQDYYYMSENTDNNIVCSVLFYKLNKDEQKLMVEPFGDMITPGIPLIYFSDNSNLKKYEVNKQAWGEMTDDFMFRQNDIVEFEGIKTRQKHMYGYCMFGKDLFVNVHLSKVDYTAEDSTAMRQILDGLKKVK
jgi:hypothetical protein